MVAWEERPIEVAHLFNPAYCSLLLGRVVEAYSAFHPQGMTFPVVFLVLPVLLHKKTRLQLPRDVRTKLQIWMQKHHEARVGFAKRMQNLVPVTKEALLFGLQHEVLQLSESGALLPGPRALGEFPAPPQSDTAKCLARASFLGDWFAGAGKPATLVAAWGVRIE